VDDALAPAVNPAGLGFMEASELRLVLARDLRVDRLDLGMFAGIHLGALNVGASLELDRLGDDTQATPGLALALGSRDFSFGAGWRGGPGLDTFSLGVTWHVSRNLSFSGSTLDLAQKLGPRPYDIGVGVRLFGERVLLSGRWRLLQGEDVSSDDGRPDIRALLSVEPIEGLILTGATDLHFRPAFQLTLNFEHLAGTGGMLSDADGDPATALVELAVIGRDLPSSLRPARVLVLELSGDLAPDPRFNLLSLRFDAPVYGDIPLLLDEMARSEDVAGVFVRIGSLEVGWGRAQELRAALVALVEADKRVDCMVSATEDLELFVASACTSIAVLPSMPIGVDGIAANALFLADGLEMIGVRPQVVARGDYKTAPEMFTRAGMSDPHRESLGALLADMYEALVSGIASGRRLERDQVEAIIARGTMTATEAKERGLVDTLLYPDEAEDWLRGSYGGAIGFIDAQSIPRPSRQRWSSPPRIAVVTIDAPITGGESSDLPLGLGDQSGAVTLVRTLDALKNDSSVRAVVLRVESPGGDAVASDLIARAVARLEEVKPVIASFGDVAASGGYYVAAPARAIYAEPCSITGSIGVYSLGFSLEGLLGKLGINVETLSHGAGATRGSLLRDWTDAEREMAEREVSALYAQFVRVVADGREMKLEEVDRRAQGRVWSGQDAKEHGLVDELGGFMDAVRRARREAGLRDDQEVEVWMVSRDGLGLPDVVRSVVGEDGPSPVELVPHPLRRIAESAAAILKAPRGAAALLPFVLEVD
jgi:protease-4